MLYIKQGSRFTLDGMLYEVVSIETYGPGVWVNSRRLTEPLAPLFQHGVGALQFYRNNGRLKLV